MARAIDVAKFLLYLAANEDEPDFLSHLRLQKLLYYVQGWSLALRDRPMFDERIEAWANGPVVRALYSTFANYGFQPIPPEHFDDGAELTDEEAEFIVSVWESYKGFSASSLWKMTHLEPPWVEARNGYGPADRCDNPIGHDSMRQFFVSEAQREASGET
jgi:uncharacterized phage-associated protein